MVVAVLTAHADYRVTTRDPVLLQWLEDQALEISFIEQDHLLAADSERALLVDVRIYPLDGGQASQVRWQLRHQGKEPPAEDPLERLIELQMQLEEDPRWHGDACRAQQESPSGQENPAGP